MNNINLTFKNNIWIKNYKNGLSNNFSKKFDKIFLEIKSDIKNKDKTLHVLDKNFKFNFNVKDLKNFKKFKSIAFIGIGGSILGTEAIYNFFRTRIKKKIYFLNNIDESQIANLKKKNLSKILFIITSKSGSTIETLSNTFALNIIKKNAKNIIIITEKKNNLLFSLANKFGLFYIEHKNYIGGRYSVLSEVGVIPSYLMGVNINKLRLNLLGCLAGKGKTLLKKSIINLAILMKSKKINNLIFLNYFPELEKFLYWSQQLIAESLGKKNKGLLPLISNAPKDHHSLLQLYLDGPKDKFFNIISFEKEAKEKINLKNFKINNFLNKKRLSYVKNAQKKAVIKSFKIKKIPFREFRIKNANEEALGELFSFFIIETVILGKLLNLNPYDQPAVEQVKVYTKKFLT